MSKFAPGVEGKRGGFREYATNLTSYIPQSVNLLCPKSNSLRFFWEGRENDESNQVRRHCVGNGLSNDLAVK